MTILIAFAGRAGCGKDTAADYLKKHYGFIPMAFAAPLKRTAAVLFDLPEIYFHDRLLKETPLDTWDGLTPRHILQMLGTEAIRTTFGQDFWLKRWISEYRMHRNNTNVVVTDVRFNNEAQLIRDLGGVVIHLVRPDVQNLDQAASWHASEIGVGFVGNRDKRISNDGSITDLHIKIDQLFIVEAAQ